MLVEPVHVLGEPVPAVAESEPIIADPVAEPGPGLEEPVPAPAEPEPVAGLAVAVPKADRKYCTFGPFVVNELWPHGVHSGFSIVCNRHLDATDTSKNKCATGLDCITSKEALSHEETILRLKRWAALGYNVPVAGDTSRTDHMKKIRARQCSTPLPLARLEAAFAPGDFAAGELEELM